MSDFTAKQLQSLAQGLSDFTAKLYRGFAAE
jgi:hypothetical protein